jgi:hypothetical protein
LSHGRAYGAATSRGEAQVLRLSAIYAALDCSPLVEACHLHAALAVWDYCLASARLFFDDSPIDPTVQRIGKALDAAPGVDGPSLCGPQSKTQSGRCGDCVFTNGVSEGVALYAGVPPKNACT